MCALSVVMADGLNWPPHRLKDPEWKEHLEHLMKIARKYDVDHAQADCDYDDKQKALDEKAKALGVTLEFPNINIGDEICS